MHFTKISAVLFGLASFATASPIVAAESSLAVREAATPSERGLTWKPRSLDFGRGGRDRFRQRNGRNNNNIIIGNRVNIQLTQIQIIQQVQLVNIVQNLIVIDGGDIFRDNIRRHHFRNENRRRNRRVNTVVIVVTQVVDIRDVNRRNNRFLTRQVESNPEFASREFVVLTEQSTLTAEATATSSATFPSGTDVGAAAVQTQAWDESSPLDVSAQSLLLPEGQAAPRWEGFASQVSDPALILEDGENGAFVGFA